MSECPYCWFSHGCDLPEGHSGDHQCITGHEELGEPPSSRPPRHHDLYHFETGQPEQAAAFPEVT